MPYPLSGLCSLAAPHPMSPATSCLLAPHPCLPCPRSTTLGPSFLPQPMLHVCPHLYVHRLPCVEPLPTCSHPISCAPCGTHLSHSWPQVPFPFNTRFASPNDPTSNQGVAAPCPCLHGCACCVPHPSRPTPTPVRLFLPECPLPISVPCRAPAPLLLPCLPSPNSHRQAACLLLAAAFAALDTCMHVTNQNLKQAVSGGADKQAG